MPGIDAFSEAVLAEEYNDFVSQKVILRGETHTSAPMRAFTTGLKWVFEE